MEIQITSRLRVWLTPYGEEIHKKNKITMLFMKNLPFNDFTKVFEGLVLNCR